MENFRFSAVERASCKQPIEPVPPAKETSSYYGCLVFNRANMRRYLSEDTRRKIYESIEKGVRLDPEVAEHVAEGMKRWALDLGATHYTHWFQPLTGGTAEKHDSFAEPRGHGESLERFSGKMLRQAEPDASSFPSGGLRNTFEARGYTAWDPSSPAFIMGDTLCIPTVFVSYTGEALDYKTPELRSEAAVAAAAKDVLAYFGEGDEVVHSYLGWEQEYFLVDRELYALRPDLVLTDRTLIGHDPARSQQLDDHYFAAIPPRVVAFMRDLEIEGYKLGIPLKTRHNEVAPNQFEVAPVYEEANLAIDHNLLLMSLMKNVAERHGFEALFHEKPFDGINGSGKHCNWSIGTESGIGLMSPGKTDAENLRFLCFMANTLAAVYDHNSLVKASVVSATNAHRLGGNEAPPAIISCFLGEQVTEAFDELLRSKDMVKLKGKKGYSLGIPQVPELLLDNTDRNRTSSFAFTGNRFELRATGSSANCSGPITVLNTIVAAQLRKFKAAVDKRIEGGAPVLQAVLDETRETYRRCKGVCFDGNGYSDEWPKEAKKRGLDCESSVPKSLTSYVSESTVALFASTGVMSKSELESREGVFLETYCKKEAIEGKVLSDLTTNHVIPVAIRYQNILIENVKNLKEITQAKDFKRLSASQMDLIDCIAEDIAEAEKTVDVLDAKIAELADRPEDYGTAAAYESEVVPLMAKIRKHVDSLEMMVDDQMWPLPKYRELLFIHRGRRMDRGPQGLYDPGESRDSCGAGLVADVRGRRSHAIVEDGLRILARMAHRGAENVDGRTGDGSGITIQLPRGLFVGEGVPLPEEGHYGAGNVFLPRDGERAGACDAVLRRAFAAHGLTVLATREVPVDRSVPGPLAAASEPAVVQYFVSSFDGRDELERKLYLARRAAEKASDDPDFYVCSLSTRTIVYKGMLTPAQLPEYYPDLRDPRTESAVAMVHSRFSTNTVPAWKLAQPFRMLCHNGEINTIRANRAWMDARGGVVSPDAMQGRAREALPVVQPGMSDSASLDNAFEFLAMAGMAVPNAATVLIPESWNERNPIPDSLRAYYEYNSILMEPWDGPANVLFTDGEVAGGMLDRNGLRPSRWCLDLNGRMIIASEAGVLDVPPSEVLETGRVGPGKMVMVDMAAGRILGDKEIKSALADAYPYRDWLDRNRLDLSQISSGRRFRRDAPFADRMRAEYLYTKEDVETVLLTMASETREPTGSTGCDIPLAPLSRRPQLLFNYFRQQFAQVTNPPIDPIREELVMSVTGYIGSVHNDLLSPTPETCRIVKVRHPVVTDRELDLLEHLAYRGFTCRRLDATFPVSEGGEGLERALDRLRAEAEEAVDANVSCLIVSDAAVAPDRAAVPSLLAVASVHQRLMERGKRLQTGIISESGEPREVEHAALLIAYGANLVNPYLALAEIDRLAAEGGIGTDPETAEWRYCRAMENGIRKIMSKMGVSVLRSYRGSRLFEAVGLSRELCRDHFSGTFSALGGIGLGEVADDCLSRHAAAFGGDGAPAPPDEGVYTPRNGGEAHAWDRESVRLLHEAAADPSAYRAFAERSDGRTMFVRDLLGFAETDPVPIGEVEPAESIARRFAIEAISFGAVGKEAHEALAEAAAILGCRSNCGEGGEPDGRTEGSRSKARQIASGRFGVTTRYLVEADEIQIKMAQGAKPGEGGQLLGSKVDAVIAATRHTAPGMTLISPPPHHDIYSIEDLKQLILDLRYVNPTAEISVKLASERGVGTVAAGVAKAGADSVLISGWDGGTGAAPQSSRRYAGMPWETGLAEAQQALTANGLRGRIRIAVDGQLRDGRDVVVAALLGADRYGFATAALVSLGCVMCRKCQSNACPVGIATQDPALRARFKGSARNVANYLTSVAEDVRARLAALGLRSLDEAVGRTDLLVPVAAEGRAGTLDASPLLFKESPPAGIEAAEAPAVPKSIDERYMYDALSAVRSGKKFSATMPIRNTDRSAGARLSGEAVRLGLGLDKGDVSVRFEGTAGQSFGAFLVGGIEFSLRGQANDYVGKGLSGGIVSVFPDGRAAASGYIAGNTALYGATSGEAYFAGEVGERFCVRNSGAVAVAEGAGDHCCEYMTGGTVVIIGDCGRNFAAGMSGGTAYVLNAFGEFDRRCNTDMVEIETLDSEEDDGRLRGILEEHVRRTGSERARSILKEWRAYRGMFLKVVPANRRTGPGRPAPSPVRRFNLYIAWMRARASFGRYSTGVIFSPTTPATVTARQIAISTETVSRPRIADAIIVRTTPMPSHTAYAVVNATPWLIGQFMQTMLRNSVKIENASQVRTVNPSV